VREWLKELPKEDCKTIGADILAVQYAWPVGKPLVDNLGDGLWEVRSRLSHRIARTLFAVVDEEIVLLHASSRNNRKRHRPNSTWRKNVRNNIWRIYEQKKTSRR
jgi:phage-related protein